MEKGKRIRVSADKLLEVARTTYLEAQDDGPYQNYHVVEIHEMTGNVSNDIFASEGWRNEGWIQVAVFRFADDESSDYVPAEFDPDEYATEAEWAKVRQDYLDMVDMCNEKAAIEEAQKLLDSLEAQYPQFQLV